MSRSRSPSKHLVEEGVAGDDSVVDPGLPIHQSDSSASGSVVEIVDVEAIVSSAEMAEAYSGLMTVLCARFWNPPDRVALTLAHWLADFCLKDKQWVNSRLEVVYPPAGATSSRWTIGGWLLDEDDDAGVAEAPQGEGDRAGEVQRQDEEVPM